MSSKKASKKIPVVCAVVLAIIVAVTISAAAVHHNNVEKSKTSYTVPALNPDEESTTAELIQTTQTTTKKATTKKKKNYYSAIEADMGNYAFHYSGAKMKFRECDGNIYYADEEDSARAIFRYDPKSGKTERVFEIPSAKTYGSAYRTVVKLCEKGVIVEYCSDDAIDEETIADYYFFARSYKDEKDISKNVNEYSNEFDGEKIYIANNEDSSVECVNVNNSGDREYSFKGYMYLPSELNEYYLEQVFTSDGKIFGILVGGRKYNKYRLVKIESKTSIKSIAEISENYYIADKKFYYCNDGMLYSINLDSNDYKEKEIVELDCDVLYIVTKDRAYYCIRQKNKLACIYYIDLKTETSYRITSSKNRSFEF